VGGARGGSVHGEVSFKFGLRLGGGENGYCTEGEWMWDSPSGGSWAGSRDVKRYTEVESKQKRQETLDEQKEAKEGNAIRFLLHFTAPNGAFQLRAVEFPDDRFRELNEAYDVCYRKH
jgi:hypothetical protein